MLHDLLTANRKLLLEKSARQSELMGKLGSKGALSHGRIFVFLDQVTEILRVEHASPALFNGEVKLDARPAAAVQMSKSAAAHGAELRKLGFTIEEVVRNYGGMCQAITSLAMELNAEIELTEFRTLNWCLDEATAQAVMAYTEPEARKNGIPDAALMEHEQRLDNLAMMIYNLHRAMAAVTAIRTGRVGLEGATGAVLDQSLKNLEALIDESIGHKI